MTLSLTTLFACASGPLPNQQFAAHRQALSDTEKRSYPAPGSAAEKEAVERFMDFFAVFSEPNIRAKISATYAEDCWFNDTLKTIRGRAALEHYMLESAAGTESTNVEFIDWVSKSGDVYVRWAMHIRFKKFRGGKTQSTIGMTHLRFDDSGRVVFHQDYWDSSQGLFEHVPVVGGLIRWVKRKL